MIILRHGKFISGARIFRAGEILPSTAGVQSLVARKLAEVVDDIKATKATKKREPDKAGASPENVEVNS